MDVKIVFSVLSSVDRMIHLYLTVQIHYYQHLDGCIRPLLKVVCALGFLDLNKLDVC